MSEKVISKRDWGGLGNQQKNDVLGFEEKTSVWNVFRRPKY
ncbi:MAG: hypothetical protein V7L29_19235 [Nostoc sp.]